MVHKIYSKGVSRQSPMSEEYTTIRVSKTTKERLEKFGEMGMSYDEVIAKVLDELEGGNDE